MADPQYPSTPQSFTFAQRALVGFLVGFSGRTPRRSVTHEFPKRDGALEEDMARGPRTLEVRLQFLGPNCAKDYAAFEAFVNKNPVGTIVHPVAGQWVAFCKGPQHQVNFQNATNQIEVTVAWTESQLDATITAADTPDVATAAQSVTDQQNILQQTVATFMAAMAKAQTAESNVLSQIDDAIASVALLTTVVNVATGLVTTPVDVMRSALNVALGGASSIVGALNTIATYSDLLYTDVNNLQNFVNSVVGSNNAGSDTPSPGYTYAIANQLGTVTADAATLEVALVLASPRPATAAAVVSDVELMVDTCMTLNDAILAAQPPVTTYVVTQQTNLLVMAQQLLQKFQINRDALAYGSAILGLNRIQNPAAIAAGTVLLVPTQ